MTLQPAGTELSYTVTYLEMTSRPGWGYPHTPANAAVSLLMAETPPYWYFLSLYDAVGRDYAWEDAHQQSAEDLQAWLDDPAVTLHTLMSKGWPHGFFIHHALGDGTVDLSYFGLVPEAMGKGLGTFLLKTAIQSAWDIPDTNRLTVDTCTLDHPRALQTYQKHGFSPVRREDHTRILRRPRDLSRIPD